MTTFEAKVEAAREFVENLIKRHSKPVVACSFGKNSMVVLHPVRQFEPDVCVLFNDTLVEYPDSYDFKDYICKEWDLRLIETKPTKTFWWVVEKYGFPTFSRKGHRDASKSCPRYLKEYPSQRIQRQYRFDLYFTGLSRHESRLREFSARKYGAYFYSKRNKHWKCHPILNWTESDVWQYHNRYDMPHNPIYDKKAPSGFHIRTACWCCTIPIKYGKLEFLRMNYPELWRLILGKGLGKLIAEKKLAKSITDSHVAHLLESHPEFFDRL